MDMNMNMKYKYKYVSACDSSLDTPALWARKSGQGGPIQVWIWTLAYAWVRYTKCMSTLTYIFCPMGAQEFARLLVIAGYDFDL